MDEQLYNYLKACIEAHVQDVYFKPKEKGWELLQRTAVAIQKRDQVDAITGRRYLNSLKYVAQMDVSEKRRPQSGRWQMTVAHSVVYLRLATVGNFLSQESLVIRFIYPIEALEKLPFDQRVEQLAMQTGLIIFTGATGSGKTTSMYRLAQHRASEMTVTIEDPVEIVTPQFLQLQVNEAAGLDYGALLKISLRLRPDTLIIGEIRDALTARYVLAAALSGHLVLTTLHARSASGVVARLLDLGITKSQLVAALTGVVYQEVTMISGQPRINYEVQTSDTIWTREAAQYDEKSASSS